MRHWVLLGLIAALLLMPACERNKQKRTDEQIKANVDDPAPPAPVPTERKSAIDAKLQQRAIVTISAYASGQDDAAKQNPGLQANAIETLQYEPGDDARKTMLAALGSNSAVVRSAAAMAVGYARIPSAKPMLLRMVNDRDLRVQASVRYALHRLGDTSRTLELQKKFAVHSDRWVRGHTAFVIGRLGEPSGARVLGPMLEDDQPSVRLQAAEALWRLGDKRGLQRLRSLSISNFADDRMVALPAIAAGRPNNAEVRQSIRGQLTGEWPEVRLAAARAMGMLGRAEGAGVALTHIEDKQWRRRYLAALALGAIGRADLQPALEPRLLDERPEVRLAAAAALREIARKHVERDG